MQLVVVSVGVLVSACTTEPALSETESASTVSDYTGSTGCSTAVVIGLSKQIADEAGCENPASFVSFSNTPGITLASNAVLPYLVKGARDDLEEVATGSSLTVTSALRSIAQQYLLYNWYVQGRCGITAAAHVGTSNHEGGRAVDLSNYSARISAMAAHGWAHDVAGDPVHFDHTASPDERGQDTKAFQVLWNRNHPNDLIAEDGAYGPATEARLKQAPATGFAIGPACHTDLMASVVSIDGPDRVPPQTLAHYTIIIKNSGATPWPATTKLQIASGDASPLYDTSWTSATVVTTLGAIVDANQQTMIDMDVMTPMVTDETPLTQAFELDDAGTSFGTIDLALTVAPGADMGTSGDPGDEAADDQSGGCSTTGGGAGWLGLAIPALMLRRRRR
ncbi:MAG: M15 family metallopeptidase [Kofleriaceae bacterium]